MTRSTSTSRTSNRTLQSLSDCSAVRRERIANLVENCLPRIDHGEVTEEREQLVNMPESSWCRPSCFSEAVF